jgi:hypothetical protein
MVAEARGDNKKHPSQQNLQSVFIVTNQLDNPANLDQFGESSRRTLLWVSQVWFLQH